MDVVNSTSSLVIHSQCGITDTQYNYTVSPRSTPCDNYTFTVTPVNRVGNGTSTNVTLLSDITECKISLSLLIVIMYDIIAIILLAPQQIESGDLEDVALMNNSTYYNIVMILRLVIAKVFNLVSWSIDYNYTRVKQIYVKREKEEGEKELYHLLL